MEPSKPAGPEADSDSSAGETWLDEEEDLDTKFEDKEEVVVSIRNGQLSRDQSLKRAPGLGNRPDSQNHQPAAQVAGPKEEAERVGAKLVAAINRGYEWRDKEIPLQIS